MCDCRRPPLTLFIVGASARAAACSARRGGCRVVSLDLFGDVDLVECGVSVPIPWDEYPAGILPRARACLPEVDGWMYTGALENAPDVLEELAGHGQLWGVPPSGLTPLRDPFRLASYFASHEIVFPKCRESPPVAGNGWLIKSTRSSGGNGIQFAGTSHESASRRPADSYFQEFVDGPSYAGAFIANGRDCRLLGVTRQRLMRDVSAQGDRNDFRYVGSVGPQRLSRSRHDQWVRLGQLLTRDFGIRGLFGVDAIQLPDGLCALEINPRYTSSMEVLERALEVSLVGLHIDACRSEKLPTVARPKSSWWGKRILYAKDDYLMTPAFVAFAVGSRRMPNRTFFLADIPQAGTTVPRRFPITTLLAGGESEAEVEKRLGYASRRDLCHADQAYRHHA